MCKGGMWLTRGQHLGQSLMCTIALCAMCCGDLPGAKSDVYHCRVCGVCCADVAQTASTSSRSARALCMTSTCVCSAKTPSNIHWRRRRRRRPVAARTGRRGCRMRWCLRSPSFASRWFTSCRRTVSEWVSEFHSKHHILIQCNTNTVFVNQCYTQSVKSRALIKCLLFVIKCLPEKFGF